MLSSATSYSMNAALLRLQVLLLLQNETGQAAIDAVLNADGARVIQSGLIPGGMTESGIYPGYVRPHCYWAVTATGKRLLFLSGLIDEAQAQETWYEYRNPAGSYLLNSAPYYTPYDRALWSLQSMMPAGILDSLNSWVCGYSFGGALGHWVASRMRENNRGAMGVVLVTFGSPKPYSNYRPGAQPSYTPQNSANFVLSNDPVPLIMPDLTEMQRILAGLNVFQGQRLSGWITPRNTYEIDADGHVAGGRVGSAIVGDPVTAIRSWIAAAESGVGTAHSLESYIARVTLAGGRLPQAVQPYVPDSMEGGTGVGNDDPTPSPSPNAQNIIAPVLTNGQVAVVQAEVQTQFFRQSTGQQSVSVEIPEDQLFHAYRVGHLWFVSFRGQTFAAGAHKRGARQLARFGNAFLRSLQSRAAVSAPDLIGAWQQYLADAAVPGGGFQPTLIDQL